MTNPCIKTGAICRFEDYGQTFSVDLFKVGNVFIIRTHPYQVGGQEGRSTSDTPVDLTVTSHPLNDEFWRSDIGVFVVRQEMVKIVNKSLWDLT